MLQNDVSPAQWLAILNAVESLLRACLNSTEGHTASVGNDAKRFLLSNGFAVAEIDGQYLVGLDNGNKIDIPLTEGIYA